MATVDMFNLLFRDILKISPNILYNYTTIQDQILYLFFIPTVILLLFIVAFSRQIVLRVLGEHKGFQYIISIVAYVYLVYSGIYGATLVPLFLGWLTIAIVLSLIVFLVSVVIHPARGPALTMAGHEAGKMIGQRVFENKKKKKALDNEIKVIEKQIRSYEREARSADPHSAAYLKVTIGNLKAQRIALKNERDKLK